MTPTKSPRRPASETSSVHRTSDDAAGSLSPEAQAEARELVSRADNVLAWAAIDLNRLRYQGSTTVFIAELRTAILTWQERNG